MWLFWALSLQSLMTNFCTALNHGIWENSVWGWGNSVCEIFANYVRFGSLAWSDQILTFAASCTVLLISTSNQVFRLFSLRFSTREARICQKNGERGKKENFIFETCCTRCSTSCTARLYSTKALQRRWWRKMMKTKKRTSARFAQLTGGKFVEGVLHFFVVSCVVLSFLFVSFSLLVVSLHH